MRKGPELRQKKKFSWSLGKALRSIFVNCNVVNDVASTVMYTFRCEDEEEDPHFAPLHNFQQKVRGQVLETLTQTPQREGRTLEVPNTSLLDDEISCLSAYTLEEMEHRRQLEAQRKREAAKQLFYKFGERFDIHQPYPLKHDSLSLESGTTVSCSDSSDEELMKNPSWGVRISI